LKLPNPLYRGRLVKRYKRFLADVVLDDGTVLTAHCPNPGAMTGVAAPGSIVWLSKSDNPKRKLAFTFELIEVDGQLVGVNTNHPNAVVTEAVIAGQIPELGDYGAHRREVKYGENSRIDLLLSDPDRGLCYVEVKNVHLKRQRGLYPGAAEFPDSVTKRGAKHLAELAAMVAAGHRAVSVYLVQRMDCDGFSLADDIDPAYAAAFKHAAMHGVETLVLTAKITTDEITVDGRLPLVGAALH
jgi:sugar fermentation stimulation protein A